MKYIEEEYRGSRLITTEHRVLYIEYIDGTPFNVMTACNIPDAVGGAYWCMHHWDFFKNCGDNDDVMYYNSGFGGCAYKDGINAPHFVEGSSVEIWKDKDVPFIGEPKNAVILAEPKGNPFDNASESLGYDHCDRCGHDINTTYDWGCEEHMYIDDDGELRYIDNDEFVN